MPGAPLTIYVDPEAARAFEAASAEGREKIQLLLGLRLRELVSGAQAPLRTIMDEMGREAEARDFGRSPWWL